MSIPMPKGTIMKWSGNSITDHNRGALSVDVEKIENSKRMANGTLRKVVIAEKRSWSTDWSDLPDLQTATVDGFWGARDIEGFYMATPGVFTLTINDGTLVTNFSVVFKSFSKTIAKRGANFNLWTVNIALEEV